MSKNQTIKEALKSWEEKHPGQKPEDQKILKLLMYQPFINKMDASIASFSKLEQLSLSTNQIEKISNLQGLDSLKILSLGRRLKAWKQLLIPWKSCGMGIYVTNRLSYNMIEKLNGIECCKKLKVLYISNNRIKDYQGLQPAAGLTLLEDVLFSGNPVEEKASQDESWIPEITKRLPFAKKLDGKTIIREEVGGMEDEKSRDHL